MEEMVQNHCVKANKFQKSAFLFPASNRITSKVSDLNFTLATWLWQRLLCKGCFAKAALAKAALLELNASMRYFSKFLKHFNTESSTNI